jgi:hypothetical protein
VHVLMTFSARPSTYRISVAPTGRARCRKCKQPACDGSRGEYAEDVPSKFRLQIAQDATRATVMQAYRADALCLGYEGIGLGPSPSPSPSPTERASPSPSPSSRYEDTTRTLGLGLFQ